MGKTVDVLKKAKRIQDNQVRAISISEFGLGLIVFG